MESRQADQTQNEKKGVFAKWIKRFGFWGFMFFLIKGLLWLIVPAVLIWLGYSWE